MLGKCQISTLDTCEHCVYGKATRVSFGKGKHCSKQILDYVHADLWGPENTPSLDGAHYFLSIVDDFSRRVWVYLLKSKGETYSKFVEWKTLVERQTEKKLKALRTDNGLEFLSGEFKLMCQREGIERHLTVKGTPQKNGLAERMNRTLLERVRCLLSNVNLSKEFWGEVVITAAYLIIGVPHLL